MRPIRLLILALACIPTFACGGGGGGSSGGSTDSGSVTAEITPSVVTEGNLAFVSVHFNQADFDDLDTQGITVKLLIPSDLALVPNSATLTLNLGGEAITPLAVVPVSGDFAQDVLEEKGALGDDTSVADGEFTMYVFPLDPHFLDEEDEGFIQATFAVNGQPEHPVVFTDIDRGAITSFDIQNADFDAESSTTFSVLPVED